MAKAKLPKTGLPDFRKAELGFSIFSALILFLVGGVMLVSSDNSDHLPDFLCRFVMAVSLLACGAWISYKVLKNH